MCYKTSSKGDVISLILSMASFLRFGVFFILAASVSAAPQLQCPRCPLSDNIAESLVAQSGGSRGVPLFCGYSFDSTGAGGPQTFCFYGQSSGGVFSGGSNCPSLALLGDCPTTP
ncbi:hypothetical protein BD779DRAFT_1548590 [Infundibulicybe gibba]|nr:hypothetical protein BD779DRAFT_1548590 [Infundibulicybe gibba]